MPASTNGEPVGATDGGDLFGGRRADGVAVDEHRLGIAGGEGGREPLRQLHGIAGRQDRQDEVGGGDLLVARSGEAGGLRALDGLVAAAGERGQNLEAVGGEAPSDGGAHHAGGDDCNDWVHDHILHDFRFRR